MIKAWVIIDCKSFYLASEARAAQQFFAPPQFNGNIYPAPPPAYTTLSPNTYGWVPTDRFPERPQGENVFMYDTPPPYAGIFPNQQQTHQFEARNRVTNVSNGYVNPNEPSKVYVAATAPYVRFFSIFCLNLYFFF